MIVDCYTHIWDTTDQLGQLAATATRPPRASGSIGDRELPNAGVSRHATAAKPVDATIVIGFKSLYLDAEISNEAVAGYVRTNPQRLIGFAGIDPVDGGAGEAMIQARDELGLKGIALSPAAQDVHPCSSGSSAIYERAVALNVPVLFHSGIQLTSAAKLEYAQPVLLDEVAREFPDLRIVIAHLGYPWVKETLVLLAKHRHVYADVSGVLQQPWEAYQALLAAHTMGVMDKLLFGSGFPFGSPAESIEALYGVNHIAAGTNLPKIPRDALRAIVECDALAKLGISHDIPAERVAPPESGDDADLT